MAWAKFYPSLTVYTDNIRIIEALENEGLLPSSQAENLIEAYKTYRSMVHRLALQGLSGIVSDDVFSEERKQVTAVWDSLIGE